MDEEFEIEIKNDFIVDVNGLFEDTEESFMKLADGNTSIEIIDEVFRLFHNLKGSAAAVGFNHLAKFAHKVEDVLTAIKKKVIAPDLEVCFFLMRCNDLLKKYIDGLSTNLNFTLSTDEYIAEIDVLLEQPNVQLKGMKEQNLEVENNNTLSNETTMAKHVVLSKSEVINENFPVEEKKMGNIQLKKEDKEKVTAKKEYIKIESSKLDNLVNYVGELVVNQAIMSNANKQSLIQKKQVKDTIKYMDKLIADVRDISLSLRMMPIKPVFQRMKRIVKELSHQQNKNIDFIIEGEGVELDKTVLEKITDPLVHLIRNAIDHGIEGKSERNDSNKNITAKVSLIAKQQDDNIVIKIIDDGKGLDREQILNKAIVNGLVSEHVSLTDQEVYSLIFSAGLSTKECVSSVSGRGVGMDVVKKAITELKGSISIESTKSIGTTFIITLPLSLSIIQGMLVEVKKNTFIIPLSQLIETIDYKKHNIVSVNNKGRMINLRGSVIPVLSLLNILKLKRDTSIDNSDVNKNSGKGILTMYKGAKVSFEVDRIIGQQEVVIKKLGDEVHGIPGIFAGAILGNGEPSLLLNLHDFL